MNCHKIRKQLPLLAGDDLPLKRKQKIRDHLKGCRTCWQELEQYAFALGEIKEWLNQEPLSWEESEWQKSVSRALQSKETGKKEMAPWPFHPIWAGLAMLVLTAVISLVLLKPLPPGKDHLSLDMAAGEESSIQQEIVAFTLVSKESGLKINWFLNKNFDLNNKEELE